MTEEVLQQFPETSEFRRVTVKPGKEIFKQAVIDANPKFASLNWDDFEFSGGSTYPEENWDTDNYRIKDNVQLNLTLKLKDNPDRIRYYRNRTPYQFYFKPLDATSLLQAMYGPLVNKTFKFELKDQLNSYLSQLSTFEWNTIHEFKKVKISDNEFIYFFATQLQPEFYYNGVYRSSWLESNPEMVRDHLDFFKQHIPYIRFVAEAVSEDEMISTPDQPSQPNLTINPSNVYTVS